MSSNESKNRVWCFLSLCSLFKNYLFIGIVEYSRFSFAFPCNDMAILTVVKSLDELLTLCDTTSFFSSLEFEADLEQRGFFSNKCSICYSSGNRQAEKTVQTVWKTTQLALKAVYYLINNGK